MPMKLSGLVDQSSKPGKKPNISRHRQLCSKLFHKIMFLVIQHVLLSIFDEGFKCTFPLYRFVESGGDLGPKIARALIGSHQRILAEVQPSETGTFDDSHAE